MIFKKLYVFVLISVFIAALHLVLISGCRKKNENPVVAEVNQEKIYLDDYNDFSQKVPETTMMAFSKSPEELLKHLITRKLLVQEVARRGLLNQDTGRDISEPDMIEAVQSLLASEMGERPRVSEDEIEAFYHQRNKELGGKPMSEVRKPIRRFILARKQQDALGRLVDRLYQKADIRIFKENLPQVKAAGLAPSNKEDFLKAISSGRPTLVDFGSNRCIPCLQLRPVLKALKDKFQGKVNVMMVEVNQERDLTREYRIRVIPTLIFFDAKGNEIGRQMGFMGQRALEKKMKGLGMV